MQKVSQPYATNLSKKDIPKNILDDPSISSEIRKTKPVKVIFAVVSKPLDYLKSSENDQTKNLKKCKNFTSLPSLKQCSLNMRTKRKTML